MYYISSANYFEQREHYEVHKKMFYFYIWGNLATKQAQNLFFLIWDLLLINKLVCKGVEFIFNRDMEDWFGSFFGYH